MYEFINYRINKESTIVMAGSLPKGFTVEYAKIMLIEFAKKGARIVIDSRAFSLDDLREIKPWLIKPNQEEISEYLGREISTLEQTLQEAQALHEAGIENVMISMGGDGALLVCSEGIFTAQPPKVEVLSTIGAGDSSIAGFISSADPAPMQRLVRAVAFGTAACMTEGTLPPTPTDVANILPNIQCSVLS